MHCERWPCYGLLCFIAATSLLKVDTKLFVRNCLGRKPQLPSVKTTSKTMRQNNWTETHSTHTIYITIMLIMRSALRVQMRYQTDSTSMLNDLQTSSITLCMCAASSCQAWGVVTSIIMITVTPALTTFRHQHHHVLVVFSPNKKKQEVLRTLKHLTLTKK